MFFLLLWACQDKTDVSFDFTSDGAEPTQEPANSPTAEPETCDYPAETEHTPAIELDGRVICGENIYMSLCAGCHGAAGEGGGSAGPPLANNISAHRAEDLIYVVLNGEGNMPGFALHGQEVADVVSYMMETF